MILLGKDLKEIEGHEVFDYADDREYKLSEDQKHAKIIPNEEEILESNKNKRIRELRILIPDMQICGLDYSDEQAELAQLLGL